MTVDIAAAEQFVLATARLLDRHRLAVLLQGADTEPVLRTLRAYRNSDGGFGHALEPDVRAAASEPAATLHALDVLNDIGAGDDPMVADAAAWIDTVADADGGVPFVLPTAAGSPRAPWMQPSPEGSHLTFALAGALSPTGAGSAWLRRGTEWCWSKLEAPQELSGFWVKFALDFLASVPDEARAVAAVERLRPLIGRDGSIPVPGGLEDERLTPLDLSPRPGGRGRALFTSEQIEADLDALERGQQEDGGWGFDWLAWSAGQAVEWRGIMTLRALSTLSAHGRVALAG